MRRTAPPVTLTTTETQSHLALNAIMLASDAVDLTILVIASFAIQTTFEMELTHAWPVKFHVVLAIK